MALNVLLCFFPPIDHFLNCFCFVTHSMQIGEEKIRPARSSSVSGMDRRQSDPAEDVEETERTRGREREENANSPSGGRRRTPAGGPSTPSGPDMSSIKLPDDPSAEPPFWCERPASKSLLRQLSKTEVKRQEGIYELIQTEKGYTRHLAILHHCFRQPLIDESVLGPDQLHTLFANLSDLMEMSTNMCRMLSQLLKEADPTVAGIGAVFLEGFARIDPHAYAVFCSNQNNAAAFYREKRRTHAAFNTRIAACEALAVCDRLSLVDFIVKPLQRLTKYPLLLKVRIDGEVHGYIYIYTYLCTSVCMLICI